MSIPQIYTGICWALADEEECRQLSKAHENETLMLLDKCGAWETTKNKIMNYNAVCKIVLPYLTNDYIEKNGGWPAKMNYAFTYESGAVCFSSHDGTPSDSGGWAGKGTYQCSAPYKCNPLKWRESKIMNGVDHTEGGKYRMLILGEKILDGDECLVSGDGWHKTPCIKEIVSTGISRRRIVPEVADPKENSDCNNWKQRYDIVVKESSKLYDEVVCLRTKNERLNDKLNRTMKAYDELVDEKYRVQIKLIEVRHILGKELDKMGSDEIADAKAVVGILNKWRDRAKSLLKENSKTSSPVENIKACKTKRPWGYKEWRQYAVETNGVVIDDKGDPETLQWVSKTAVKLEFSNSFSNMCKKYKKPDGSLFEVEE